ncbi:NUDIX hydrolase [Gottschalkiaceae bacterium SANA]|nr:NUDIX hydrolase [Gottschalkiaceae bacterium SANA]
MGYFEIIERYQTKSEQEEQDRFLMLEQMDLTGNKILTRENEAAHMTSSAVILNPALDKMLMIHHKIYDTWTWTGGHADGEDNPLGTAIREAREETGIEKMMPLSKDPISIEVLPVFGHQKKGAYVSTHLHFNTSFVLIAEETELLVLNEEETNGVQWVPVVKIGEYSNEPMLIEIYQKIIRFAQSAYKSKARQNGMEGKL